MPRVLTPEEARRMAALRKHNGAGTGRPRAKLRCPCGKFKMETARARYHVCEIPQNTLRQVPRAQVFVEEDRRGRGAPKGHPGWGGRPKGLQMPCGWQCGALLMVSQIRAHFATCPNRPGVTENKMHTLITIGFIGGKRAYLDIPLSEAIARYMKSEESDEPPEDRLVHSFEFVDEFYVYEAGK